MRRLAELSAHCDEFIWQPDDHVLLVSGTDGDVPYVLKVLEQHQGTDESSLYVTIADEFAEADDFARTVAGRCVAYYELANAERAERGEPPLEPFPEALTQARMPARARIVMAIEHLGKRLPNAKDHRVVFAMMPMRVHDWGRYARFVAEFTRLPAPAPQRDEAWPAYARLFFRDTRDHELGAALVQRDAQGVLNVDVDMSTDALAADLAEDAVDPGVAVAQRMQATMQLAQIDLSYKRYDEAAKKFAILYDYYGKADAPLMQAMCLQGAGDCLRSVAKLPQALERYQQGLAIALAAKSPVPVQAPAADAEGNPAGEPLHPNAPPIMLNLLLMAAMTCMELRQYEDAQSYYESATKLAAKAMNPYAACDALQGEGDAWRAQGKPAEALARWKDCDTIAEKYEYYDRLVTVRERVLALYQQAQRREDAEEAEHQLQVAKHLQKRKAA